ncbi:murein biosynthesis integral membrane protein MurJ [Pseudokordiimonas caeni]|uniref:murein biosynthesis integral membrane protein MurJ n=1 Tax=Pseudokordiimonas caeni TaxID=2997908 RepID=UPI00281277C4|nr:murein biosynthesis integral membrane protein MurJ [Pseudokordiimonas caeni]
MSIASRISKVGGLTLVSRLFGFIRDMLMARYLGAGMAADAFFIAFKLPNFFRRLFAEGAFSAGFVPLFSRLLGKDVTPESHAAAEAFAGRVLSVLLPVLFVFLLIMEAAMVPVMLGLTGGFEGDAEKFALTVELGRLAFPYLMLVSLVSMLAGMLNAFDRYAAAAFVPTLLNFFMIGALLTAPEGEAMARWLAVAVSLSGLAQFIWLFVAAKRAGIHLKLSMPKLSPDVRELLKVVGPAAIGAGVMQLNLLIDLALAARFLPEGSVSWLFYADRLNQLPLGVIGVAVGTVLLPSISRLLGSGDVAGANAQTNRAIEFALTLTLPAAVALIMVAPEIIATLFEREAFTTNDTAMTATALAVFAAGLPAFVLGKTLTPGYFARKDTRTPVRFAIVAVVANTALSLLLIPHIAHVGLAAASTLSSWLNVAMLYWGLHTRGHLMIERVTLVRTAKALAAAILMGTVLAGLSHLMADTFRADGLERIGALALLVIAGLVVYFSLAVLTGAIRMVDFRRIIKRGA